MDNLRSNAAALQSILPAGCELMPAVKADAYGHGAVPIARALSGWGVRAFCVASAAEGAELRRHGVAGTILILGYTHPQQFDLLPRYDLTQTVVDLAYAEQLRECKAPVQAHIAVDTGMHRLGAPHENAEEILEICRMGHLNVTGIYTHFCADETLQERDRAFTAQQAARFLRVVDRLRACGYHPRAHMLGSYGLLHYPQFGGAYARTGIALYGVLSTADDTRACPLVLRPVLSVKARVASVRRLRRGEGVGYGLAYTAPTDTTLATLAIGYADGLPRALSCGAGSVLLHGRRAPIVGRICMDQTMVDVGGIRGVRPGDTAVVIGTSGNETISACDIAAQTDTIANEVFSRLGARLPRIAIA